MRTTTSPACCYLVVALLLSCLLSAPAVAADQDPVPEPVPTLKELAYEVSNVAHRGLWRGQRSDENTVEACLNAIAHGADTCELDLQESRSGTPWLMHDTTLKRTTLCRGRVSAKSDRQLRRCRTRHGQRVPTFVSFVRQVRAFHPATKLMVEWKPASPSHRFTTTTVSASHAYGDARVSFESFNLGVLELARQHAPGIPRVAAVGGASGYAAAASAARSKAVTGVAVPLSVLRAAVGADPDFVRDLQAESRTVYAWGVDETSQMEWAVRNGVDGIVTNSCDRFAAYRAALAV